jgi:hypothetical protein
LAAGKLPLMLCLLAFVVTFITTRMITRLIRDGRGGCGAARSAELGVGANEASVQPN